jgi:hypothetical protein
LGLGRDRVRRVDRPTRHDARRKAGDSGTRTDAHISKDDGWTRIGDRLAAQDGEILGCSQPDSWYRAIFQAFDFQTPEEAFADRRLAGAQTKPRICNRAGNDTLEHGGPHLSVRTAASYLRESKARRQKKPA